MASKTTLKAEVVVYLPTDQEGEAEFAESVVKALDAALQSVGNQVHATKVPASIQVQIIDPEADEEGAEKNAPLTFKNGPFTDHEGEYGEDTHNQPFNIEKSTLKPNEAAGNVETGQPLEEESDPTEPPKPSV